MQIIKASGSWEKYQPQKIINTCLRAGVDKKLARDIVKKIDPYVHEGISTKEILRLVHKFLGRQKYIAARYNLKKAIMNLGPSGFEFEKLISRILKEYGYQTQMPPVVAGACVEHEVDIVAEKDKLRYNIECKYHNAQGIYTGLKDALYVWARHYDLQAGYKLGKCQRFDQVWLISNTKFSEQAIQYGQCKQMKMTGWNYPKKESLRDLLEKKKLYPLTVLRGLDQKTRGKLFQINIILIRDLVDKNFEELRRAAKIDVKKLTNLINQARQILA